MFICNGSNIILTASRYANSKGFYFDKSALSIIEVLKNKCLVFEPVLDKKVAYSYIYDFSFVLRRVFVSKKFPLECYNKINDALIKHFGESRITYKEINKTFHNFQSDYFFYKLIFSIKKTKKLFIATGNSKASLMAARGTNVITYLLQHGGIEADDVQFSYPLNISSVNNIFFTYYVLAFGDYWGKNINIPASQIIPIGNDFFYSKSRGISDNSILIVSTIVHGDELRLLTKQLADLKHDLKFVFKLHPNEFQFLNEYAEYFKNSTNVSVLTSQIDTNLLIAKSQLVVLIVSTVLYEALNQNKKVAIYKKINYEKYLCCSNLDNVYFFDWPDEIWGILSKNVIPADVNFYKSTDYDLIKSLIGQEMI